MPNINVGYDDVQQTATAMITAMNQMTDQLTQLLNRIDQLTQTSFKTDVASPRFQTSYTQWNNGTRQAIEGLTGMSNFLKMVIQKHQDLDSQLSSAMQ